MNEQVLKWRITIKDSREGGSLDELGSSTDDADNFQREILRVMNDLSCSRRDKRRKFLR